MNRTAFLSCPASLILLVVLSVPSSALYGQVEELHGQYSRKGRDLTLTASQELGNRPERLKWLQDAGFGMFIHWSHDSQLGSVISHSMAGALDEYIEWFVHELPDTFFPKQWDADTIARLAKICGMKYVVLTAKHHSGFCLWDSKTTDFTIMDTPYGKDLLPDYVMALRRYGIQVGFYYSPEDFDWLHRHGHPICRRGEHFVDPDQEPEYRRFVARQVTELFTNMAR